MPEAGRRPVTRPPRQRRPARTGRRPAGLRGRLAALALLAGTVALPAPAPAADTGTAGPAAAAPAPPVRPAARPGPAVADPLRVRVPVIGVDSPLVRLGLDPGGALETPADSARAGWFGGGPAPGGIGPAVLAGHVDSTRGPAVFWRLRDLAAGDEVLVDRADGTTARFAVTRVERHRKDAFPTAEVYGPTPDAQLRLITCGGDFDRAARSYRDNVVVFARLVT
ncbi:class F sortase [Blastococcus sp. SYSU D00695]